MNKTSIYHIGLSKFVLIAFSTVFLWAACSSDSGQVTGVIEGGNTQASIEGTIYALNGSKASNASYRLRPQNFITQDTPGNLNKALPKSLITSFDGTTDSTGKFRIDSLEAGSYTLEVFNESNQVSVYQFDSIADHVIIKDTLEQTVSLTGKLASLKAGSSLVKVYGLERYVLVDSLDGSFTIPNLPEGFYNLYFQSLDTSSAWSEFDLEDLEVLYEDDGEFEYETELDPEEEEDKDELEEAEEAELEDAEEDLVEV